MRRRRFLQGLVGLSILGLIAVSGWVLVKIGERNAAPEDADAIYGGQQEAGYPSAGYIFSLAGENEVSLCGITYVSTNTGVTAAHCINEDQPTFLGKERFKLRSKQNFPASRALTKPGWDSTSSQFDIALVELNPDGPTVTDTAFPATPQTTCNYVVVGYGRTEANTQNASSIERKSATICVNRINTDTFIFVGQDGGICFGDSGSAIFEKGTNRLVGVVSSILTEEEGPIEGACAIGNVGTAVRVDANREFIADGITSNAETTSACDAKLNISCPSGNICSLSKCYPASFTATGSILSGVTQFAVDLPTATLLIIFGLIPLIAGIVLIKDQLKSRQSGPQANDPIYQAPLGTKFPY